jgi:hypothetical protein
VEGLIEVYTAGNGLELMNGVFKAVAKAGSKITVDSTGIGVDLSSYYTKTEVDNLLKTIDGGSA